MCPLLDPVIPAALRGPRSRMDTVTNGDIHIFVTARPTVLSANAASMTCMRDGFGRPVIAHINVNSALIHVLATDTFAGAAMLLNVIRHELMHVLALTWTSFGQFRTSDRRLLVSVTDAMASRGVASVRFLVTPWARSAVELHYNASVAGDLALELEGEYTASRGSMSEV